MQLIADDEGYTSHERVAQICAALVLLGHEAPRLFGNPYVYESEANQRYYWAGFKSYAMGRLGKNAKNT